ncbi:MAG: glycosyltransferase family 2 protein, partial [Pseudomonadota bacterium]
MISVLILTFNEEKNIEACIQSLPWRDDVCVLDSNSTDQTVELASKMGARIETRAFTNYAEQRNHALGLDGKFPWIVMLDADERMTPDLATEIEQRLRQDTEANAMFRVRRKDMFMGRWLRKSSGYPTWFARVFKRGKVRVEREINETYEADGSIGHLGGHITHYPFNNGLDW